MDFDRTQHSGLDHTIWQKLIQKGTICPLVFLSRQVFPVEPSAYHQRTTVLVFYCLTKKYAVMQQQSILTDATNLRQVKSSDIHTRFLKDCLDVILHDFLEFHVAYIHNNTISQLSHILLINFTYLYLILRRTLTKKVHYCIRGLRELKRQSDRQWVAEPTTEQLTTSNNFGTVSTVSLPLLPPGFLLLGGGQALGSPMLSQTLVPALDLSGWECSVLSEMVFLCPLPPSLSSSFLFSLPPSLHFFLPPSLPLTCLFMQLYNPSVLSIWVPKIYNVHKYQVMEKRKSWHTSHPFLRTSSSPKPHLKTFLPPYF